MIQNQLTALFTHACKIYDLKSNPCKKCRRMGKDDARSLNFWTIDEYGEFIKTVPKGTRNYIMYEILFWTVVLSVGLIGFAIFVFFVLGGLNG